MPQRTTANKKLSKLQTLSAVVMFDKWQGLHGSYCLGGPDQPEVALFSPPPTPKQRRMFSVEVFPFLCNPIFPPQSSPSIKYAKKNRHRYRKKLCLELCGPFWNERLCISSELSSLSIDWEGAAEASRFREEIKKSRNKDPLYDCRREYSGMSDVGKLPVKKESLFLSCPAYRYPLQSMRHSFPTHKKSETYGHLIFSPCFPLQLWGFHPWSMPAINHACSN